MLDAYIDRQMRWSAVTFGPNDRSMGVLAHIEKELNEVRNAATEMFHAPTPANRASLLEEIIDVMILAIDGLWRCGNDPRGCVEIVRVVKMWRSCGDLLTDLQWLVERGRGYRQDGDAALLGDCFARLYRTAGALAYQLKFSSDQINAQLEAKQKKNFARAWPDWRTMPGDAAISST